MMVRPAGRSSVSCARQTGYAPTARDAPARAGAIEAVGPNGQLLVGVAPKSHFLVGVEVAQDARCARGSSTTTDRVTAIGSVASDAGRSCILRASAISWTVWMAIRRGRPPWSGVVQFGIRFVSGVLDMIAR